MLDHNQFLRGCIAPDKEFGDTINHHCYVAKQCKDIDVSKIEPNSLTYFADIGSCIEGGYFDCPTEEKFDEAIQNATRSDFSFYLGVATHYFTDARVPVHQTMGEDWFNCHSPFEGEVGKKLESNSRFWNVSRVCDVYFPCRKAGSVNRKCKDKYTVEVFYSYEDVVELAELTDRVLSESLNLDYRSDYSHLLRNDWRNLLDRLTSMISYIFRVLFGLK